MLGHQHRKITPVMTIGATYLMINGGLVASPLGSPALLSSLIAGGISYISANWPDADQVALMPTAAILGQLPRDNEGKQFKIVVEYDSKLKRNIKKKRIYHDIKRKDMKYIGLFMKMIGVRSHRCFLSHSPILHGLIAYFLYSTLSMIPNGGDIISFIVFSLCMGYLTHLAADQVTNDGLPILPKIKAFEKIPILNIIFGDFKPTSHVKIFGKKVFLTKNKGWVQVFFVLLIDTVLCILFPAQMIPVNLAIMDAVKSIFISLIGQINI